MYYTAQWPRGSVKFARKRIGVIGTGASGAQVVTALGKKPVSNLYVFQRTPNYILPSWNGPADEEYTEIFKSQYRRFREESRVARTGSVYPDPLGYRPEIRPIGDLDPIAANRRLWELWDCGSHVMMTSIPDLFTSKAANDRVANFLHERIRELVHDPATAELLCPRDIYLGERRVILDTDYLKTFNNRRVNLVDIRSDPIDRMHARGIILRSGAEYDLDMIILATGFDSGTGSLLAMDIRGRNGVSLRDAWRDGPKTFLGLMASGFPNLFMIAQLGSPGIRSQVLNSIEQHVEWLTELFTDMRTRSVREIEASQTSEERWTRHVADLAARSLQATHNTQYWGTNIPGKPRVYLSYLGGSNRYRQICDEIRVGDWIGLQLVAADGKVLRNPEDWEIPTAKRTEYVGGI
jgi:cation diffusion facilitator CzcD-associated flavoprotein CzcO